jgi:hypothetical protein
MNRKCLALIIALLLIPSMVYAWTDTSHMDGTYPNFGGNWSCIDATPGHGSIINDPTTPDPSTSLQFTFPKGMGDAGYPAKCWNVFPAAQKEFWVQYYVKYSNNYNFHPIADKQVYFMTDYPGTGYRNNYFIGRWSDGHIVLENQGVAGGNWFSNTNYNPTLQAGRWYKITHHFKVNTIGQNNGVAEIWINDQLVMSYSNLQVIGSNNTGISEWHISPVYGGNTGATKPSEDYQYYDLAIVSTSPISGGTLPSTAVKSPNPPSSIQIQ